MNQDLHFRCIWVLCLSFDSRSPDNAHIINRTVVVVGKHLLDFLYDIQSLGDFTKHGVLSVEMGRTAALLVSPVHLRTESGLSLGIFEHLLLDGFQFLGGIGLTPYDIELAGAGASLRVSGIALASHCQGSSGMIVCRRLDFCRQRIAQIASAQQPKMFLHLHGGLN